MANLFSILFIILVAIVGGIPTIVITGYIPVMIFRSHDRTEDLQESEIWIFFVSLKYDKAQDHSQQRANGHVDSECAGAARSVIFHAANRV